MRIIAGKFKGRILKFPNSKLVRPTTDKTKESIFNFLCHSIDLEEMKVCDIYAGTGSLGLEALSRGARLIHFVEKDFNVLKTLKENISSLNADNECKIYKMEAVNFSKLSKHEQYDIFFADPPFFENDIHSVVKNIMEKNFLAENGIMIVERSIQTKEEDRQKFCIEPYKKLGDSLIYLFKK